MLALATDCRGRRVAAHGLLWLVCTVAAVLLSMCLYGYGLLRAFTWDSRWSCGVEGQTLDLAFLAYQDSGSFPLSRPCNAGFDLVPPLINSMIVALLSGALTSGLIFTFRQDVDSEGVHGTE